MCCWSETVLPADMGTQVWLDSKTGKEVHKAIFSMWDADKATKTVGVGAGCARFGGEGIGSHCLIDYQLVQGSTYTIKVRPDAFLLTTRHVRM